MSLEVYVNAANALLWLGDLGRQGAIKFIDRPPVFHLPSSVTSGVMAVTYSREHQRWVILTNDSPEMGWFSGLPWSVIVVGDNHIMPVCKDVTIPDEYQADNGATELPKFALKIDCLSAISQAISQQTEILVGKYSEQNGVTEVLSVNSEPLRVLKRMTAAA